jgi:hypothetical protein
LLLTLPPLAGIVLKPVPTSAAEEAGGEDATPDTPAKAPD